MSSQFNALQRNHGVELPQYIVLLIKKSAFLATLEGERPNYYDMLLDEQRVHMLSEKNALELSKKIYGITDRTDRSTFNADTQYRKLQLEVHPDKSWAFCDKNNIPQLHEVVLPFYLVY